MLEEFIKFLQVCNSNGKCKLEKNLIPFLNEITSDLLGNDSLKYVASEISLETGNSQPKRCDSLFINDNTLYFIEYKVNKIKDIHEDIKNGIYELYKKLEDKKTYFDSLIAGTKATKDTIFKRNQYKYLCERLESIPIESEIEFHIIGINYEKEKKIFNVIEFNEQEIKNYCRHSEQSIEDYINTHNLKRIVPGNLIEYFRKFDDNRINSFLDYYFNFWKMPFNPKEACISSVLAYYFPDILIPYGSELIARGIELNYKVKERNKNIGSLEQADIGILYKNKTGNKVLKLVEVKYINNITKEAKKQYKTYIDFCKEVNTPLTNKHYTVSDTKIDYLIKCYKEEKATQTTNVYDCAELTYIVPYDKNIGINVDEIYTYKDIIYKLQNRINNNNNNNDNLIRDKFIVMLTNMLEWMRAI